MHRDATKTELQRQDEEFGRLVRPSPKQKPPRRDLRRERVNIEDDPDDEDPSDKKDRSRNFKDIGGSIIRLVRRARDERIPAKSRETGKIVQISPDTLKERPGEYEVVEPEETSSTTESTESKEPEEKTEGPIETSKRTKFYQEAGSALYELAQSDPKLTNKLKDFGRPDSQISGLAKENPDFPAAKLFPGVSLPKGLNTLGDIKEALANAVKPSKKTKKAPPSTKPPQEAPEAKAQTEEPLSATEESPAAPKTKAPPKPPSPRAQAPQEAQEAPSKAKAPKSKKGPGTPLQNPEAKPEAQKPQRPKEESDIEPPKSGVEVLDHIPTKAELYQIKKPPRREVSSDERQATLSLLMDTFPPNISSELIAKNIHPDDVRELVRSYGAAKAAGPKNLDRLVSTVSKVYQTDPDEVDPPTEGRNAQGATVSFDQLTPEEQAESTLRHQLQVSALSLAAHDILTDKLSQKGVISGKARVPLSLASTLADNILRPPDPNNVAAIASETFKSALEEGGESLSPKSAKALLFQVSKYPGAKEIATAYMQAADYTQAKAEFLDSAEISEWDRPGKIIKGLSKAEEFFRKRNAEYETSGEHPAARMFRQRVVNRLNALDPTKAKVVRGRLVELEKSEYADQMRDWHEAMKDYLERKKKHAQAHAEYLSNPQGKTPPGPFLDVAPTEPAKPAHSFDKEEGSKLWRDLIGPSKKPKPTKPTTSKTPESTETPEQIAAVADDAWDKAQQEQEKTASTVDRFTYSLRPVMAPSAKTSVYHGIDPKTNRPKSYEGWDQFHQRDFGEKDVQAILASAQYWLKSPLLTVAVSDMVPDAKFRAALDLAIYVGPYNGAIPAKTYNELLAKVIGVKEPGRGETLLTKNANFKTENVFLAVYGPTPVDERVLKALEEPKFSFTDASGATVKDGTLESRLVRQGSVGAGPGYVGEALIKINFPEGSSEAALKVATDVLGSLRLRTEKVAASYTPSSRAADESSFIPTPSDPFESRLSMKASIEIRKFAAIAAKTNSKLAFDMLAFADHVAKEEGAQKPEKAKGQQKEASSRYSSLRSLIIRQASSLDASQRGPWLPVLQALKDL
jgi:hypothetical protein